MATSCAHWQMMHPPWTAPVCHQRYASQTACPAHASHWQSPGHGARSCFRLPLTAAASRQAAVACYQAAAPLIAAPRLRPCLAMHEQNTRTWCVRKLFCMTQPCQPSFWSDLNSFLGACAAHKVPAHSLINNSCKVCKSSGPSDDTPRSPEPYRAIQGVDLALALGHSWSQALEFLHNVHIS